ncbi:hypothetical protein [Cytobacillus firmus]|uniref:hypothetical protein n=1 Tax=Cytobacillus firmus TaxID=1399 RepID=UPI001C94AC52|nr:hypothetical protein [Cytobacillus firmus]MBY6053968.1 hypothetical protein [Cytobacillus firmus]
MYVNNVREKISSLNEKQKYELANTTYIILKEKNKIGKSIKISHILNGLIKFLNGKEISLTYFEGFLEALDKQFVCGGQNALLNKKLNLEKNWRNTLIKITTDVQAPKLIPYADDEYILKELKRLFIAAVELCVMETKEETHQTLSVLNVILNNARKSES